MVTFLTETNPQAGVMWDIAHGCFLERWKSPVLRILCVLKESDARVGESTKCGVHPSARVVRVEASTYK